MKNKSVLLTGYKGFTGKLLLELLEKKKFKVFYYILTKYQKFKPNEISLKKYKYVNFKKHFKYLIKSPLIIDSYYINKDTEKRIFIKNNNIIILDDKNERYRFSKIVISPHPFKKKFIKYQNRQIILQGSKFTIISDFIKKVVRKTNNKNFSILINFGYASNKELKYFIKNYNLIEKFIYFFLIKNKVYKLKNKKLILYKSNYKSILSKVKFCIGSPGLSQVERIFLKIPSLLFSTSKDQEYNGKYYQKYLNNYLGKLNKNNIKKITLEKILKTYKFFHKKNLKIDGKGLIRIFSKVNKILNNE